MICTGMRKNGLAVKHRQNRPHSFETVLSVAALSLDEMLKNPPPLPWLDFWLNPRRLRGSDFLMRWSQGVWSEQRLIAALNSTNAFFAVPYGPSGTAPSGNVREFELYFERLEAAGLGQIKRPDLLVFGNQSKTQVEHLINQIGGITELPFRKEEDGRMQDLLNHALLAVECENSLWRAQNMPAFSLALSPQRRLNGKLGLRKNAVLPTVILKEEDRQPLVNWQNQNRVPIHIWHVFYDLAYGLALDRSERLIQEGLTEPTIQVFQAPGGATTRKTIYKHYYHHAYALGRCVREPQLVPACIEDKNGHILPYVTFNGGDLELLPGALEILRASKPARQRE